MTNWAIFQICHKMSYNKALKEKWYARSEELELTVKTKYNLNGLKEVTTKTYADQ